MIRKANLIYKIVYDYTFKQYEEVRLRTDDRNEAMLGFLELFRKEKNGTLILEPSCRVGLSIEVNMYIRNGIGLLEYKEEDNLNEKLDELEKKLTTSYENFKYAIKLATSSDFMRNYKSIFETESRSEALEMFLSFFRQESIPDIALEVAISPFEIRCLYLKKVKEESHIFSSLTKLEQSVLHDFESFKQIY